MAVATKGTALMTASKKIERKAERSLPKGQRSEDKAAAKKAGKNPGGSPKLSSGKARNALPKSSFAVPGKRAYPVPDAAHARNALSRVAQNGSPAEQAEVKRAVASRFPSIG